MIQPHFAASVKAPYTPSTFCDANRRFPTTISAIPERTAAKNAISPICSPPVFTITAFPVALLFELVCPLVYSKSLGRQRPAEALRELCRTLRSAGAIARAAHEQSEALSSRTQPPNCDSGRPLRRLTRPNRSLRMACRHDGSPKPARFVGVVCSPTARQHRPISPSPSRAPAHGRSIAVAPNSRH